MEKPYFKNSRNQWMSYVQWKTKVFLKIAGFIQVHQKRRSYILSDTKIRKKWNIQARQKYTLIIQIVHGKKKCTFALGISKVRGNFRKDLTLTCFGGDNIDNSIEYRCQFQIPQVSRENIVLLKCYYYLTICIKLHLTICIGLHYLSETT